MNEFIFICSKKDALRPNLVALLDQADLRGSMFRAKHQAMRWILPSRAVLITRRQTHEVGADILPFFDGVGIIRERLVFGEDRHPKIPNQSVAGLGLSARGCWVSVEHQERQLFVFTDPLSLYQNWYFESVDYFICSNNAHLVAESARVLGFVVERNAFHFAWDITLQNGFNESSGYTGIRAFPFGHYLHVQKERTVKAAFKPSFDPAILYRNNSPAKELLETAAQEILTNIRAITNERFRALICDLSGGFDSRVTVAGVLNLGLQEAYGFYTDGEIASADGNVAACLRERFGLKRVDIVRKPWSPLPSYRDQVARFIFRMYGTRTINAAVGLGFYNDPLVLELNGACGETFRSNYHANVSAQKGTPNEFLRGFVTERGASLLEKQVVESQLATLDDFFASRRQEGFSEEDILDQYYIEHRNPQFFGMMCRARASYQTWFSPLYSPSAISAAFALNPQLRGQNRIGYGLMKIMAPELLKVPFAHKALSPSVLETDDIALPPVNAGSPPLGSNVGQSPTENVVIPGYQLMGETDASKSEWAQKMAAEGRHWTWARLDLVLADLKQLLNDSSVQDFCNSMFDLNAVAALTSRPPESFSNGSQVQQLYHIYGALLWASRQEIPEPSLISPSLDLSRLS